MSMSMPMLVDDMIGIVLSGRCQLGTMDLIRMMILTLDPRG